MSISDKIADYSQNFQESTVYFYPRQLKISYSSLDDLKKYLSLLFKQNIKLEEKLKASEIFINNILFELYKKGILAEDHTMVITDPLADRNLFHEATEAAYNKTINTSINILNLTPVQILKRKILVAFSIKKKHKLKEFLQIVKSKGVYHSSIISQDIDLEEHYKVKFKASAELEEYIVNILTRKALLAQGCSVYTLRLYLSIIVELVVWYSRALALIEKQTEVTSDILSASIKIVDNHYITDPAFIKMLQRNLIGNIIKLLN